MSFSKVLRGIQSGNDGNLDTAKSLYMKILCIRARPLTFFVRQGKAPSEIPENLAGSLGHVTALRGILCVKLLCRKQGKFIFCNEKCFKMAIVEAGGKPGRGVGQQITKMSTSLKVMDFYN